MMNTGNRLARLLTLLLVVLFESGCASVGSSMVVQERNNYLKAIARSREEQVLLNVVKARFSEAPYFLDIGQVVAGYNFEAGASAKLGGIGQSSRASEISTSGKYVERPTITFAPVEGRQFVSRLLRPIEPSLVFYLLESGWEPDLVLKLVVESFGQRHNQSSIGWRQGPADPGFEDIVQWLAGLASNGLMRVDWKILSSQVVAPELWISGRIETDSDLKMQFGKIRHSLNLAEGQEYFPLVYGPGYSSGNEFRLMTRSFMQILLEQSAGVEISDARGQAGAISSEALYYPEAHIKVRSGPKKPEDSYTAIQLGDYWYWIEREDIRSKEIFNFLILIFNLMESGEKPLAPVLTIQG
jgi:hypothetical protein